MKAAVSGKKHEAKSK